MIGIVDLQHVVERGRRHVRPFAFDGAPRLVPVDALDGIYAGHHVRSGLDQAKYLIGGEADISVHEKQVRGRRVVEKQRHQIGARARDQRIAIAQLDLEVHVGHRTHRPLQLEDGAGIDAGDLSAEAGCGHNEVNLLGHQGLRLRAFTIVTKQ